MNLYIYQVMENWIGRVIQGQEQIYMQILIAITLLFKVLRGHTPFTTTVATFYLVTLYVEFITRRTCVTNKPERDQHMHEMYCVSCTYSSIFSMVFKRLSY